MRFARLRRVWLVVATMSLLAGPAFASATLSFVCDGDLVGRPECCCPGGIHGGTVSADAVASVSSACCCRVTRTEAPAPAAATMSRVAAQPSTKILITPVSAPALDSLAPARQAFSVVQSAQPPPRIVPILLAQHSFRI